MSRKDPLTPEQREEFEEDLVSFCDRELDLLGRIEGSNVLYAGGTSPLWIEGLSKRIGEKGTLTALDADEERLREMNVSLPDAELRAPVRLVWGDVFEPPFEANSFDLVYSAGLFHELDVRERSAVEALAKLVSLARPGGRVATSDYVDQGEEIPFADIEWERMEAETARELSGAEYFGIGPPERLASLHERLLDGVRWRVLPPYDLRHLDRIMLSEPDEPEAFAFLPEDVTDRLRERRAALKERIRREGRYVRAATLYVEGYRK